MYIKKNKFLSERKSLLHDDDVFMIMRAPVLYFQFVRAATSSGAPSDVMAVILLL